MNHRLKQTMIIFAFMVICFTGLFDRLYQFSPLPAFEETSQAYLADVRERATYAYAAARTLNAAISLLESVELGVAVVSGNPGQVLEPINDMIEQFSDLVLVALASVGVQEILVAVLGDLSWTYLLPLALLPLLIAPWSGEWCKRLNRLGGVLCVSVILTRLLIPAAAMGGQMITQGYLQNDFDQALQQVETVKQKTREAVSDVPRVSQPLPPVISPPQNNLSVFSKTPQGAGDSVVVPDLGTVRKIVDSDQLWTLLNNLPERIITLITIFAFETIVWPVLVALLFLAFGRMALRLVER